jgi:hypothetical protein
VRADGNEAFHKVDRWWEDKEYTGMKRGREEDGEDLGWKPGSHWTTRGRRSISFADSTTVDSCFSSYSPVLSKGPYLSSSSVSSYLTAPR